VLREHQGQQEAEDAEAPAGSLGALTQAVVSTARSAGVRVMQTEAGPGEPVVQLADHIAAVDFAATYVALGLGLDPSVSPHVADLRDLTR
jgi:hypothetical protein